MLQGSLVPFENESLGTRLLVPRAKTEGVWPLKGAVTSFLGPRLRGCGLGMRLKGRVDSCAHFASN